MACGEYVTRNGEWALGRGVRLIPRLHSHEKPTPKHILGLAKDIPRLEPDFLITRRSPTHWGYRRPKEGQSKFPTRKVAKIRHPNWLGVWFC